MIARRHRKEDGHVIMLRVQDTPRRRVPARLKDYTSGLKVSPKGIPDACQVGFVLARQIDEGRQHSWIQSVDESRPIQPLQPGWRVGRIRSDTKDVVLQYRGLKVFGQQPHVAFDAVRVARESSQGGRRDSTIAAFGTKRDLNQACIEGDDLSIGLMYLDMSSHTLVRSNRVGASAAVAVEA